jgi:hypothetical protein
MEEAFVREKLASLGGEMDGEIGRGYTQYLT